MDQAGVAELADATDSKSVGAYGEPQPPKPLSDISKAGGAQSGAQTPPFDLDLQQLIDAWPTLPEPVRVGIVAMVRAAKG